ncbi:MAG: arsenate reductase ArsC, partial [Actinobacteria bacterium]|nr:arsenate reductase ArsC [Actinomycetota bacterium]
MLKILIICTGNSARSQMAEGLFKYYKKDWKVYSAGINPKGLNPLAVEIMAENGIDISGYKSKHLNLFLNKKFDYVITVCDNAREQCPVFPGNAKYMHWSLKDPASFEGTKEEKLEVLRKIRDEIENKIL